MTSKRPATTTQAAALAADYADDIIVGTVRDMHRAVSCRVFTRLGGGGTAARTLHDRISGVVYAGVSLGVRGAARGLRAAHRRGHGAPVEGGPVGRRLVAGVNALVGEALDSDGDALAIPLAARRDDRDVDDFAAAYPESSGNLVIFLHGLFESDDCWQRSAEREGGTYAERLERDTEWTPLTLRYNSGLHISDNGRRLSRWLADLLDRWPVEVQRIALVGHSMGGLVGRAACHVGTVDDEVWTGKVTRVVCLGSPHLGSPVEKAVHVGARALSLLPESAPLGRILNTRSPGITDLRHGYVCDDDWSEVEMSRVWGRAAGPVDPLPHATYHFVSACLGSERNPVGLVVGDLLVRRPSAGGQRAGGQRAPTPVVAHAELRHLPSSHHFTLLNHAQVYDDLLRWLAIDEQKETE